MYLLQGHSVEKEYPGWCMVFAFFLSIASIVPMVVIGVLRALKINVLPVNATASPMKRVATNASTRPMMPSVQVKNHEFKGFHLTYFFKR